LSEDTARTQARTQPRAGVLLLLLEGKHLLYKNYYHDTSNTLISGYLIGKYPGTYLPALPKETSSDPSTNGPNSPLRPPPSSRRMLPLLVTTCLLDGAIGSLDKVSPPIPRCFLYLPTYVVNNQHMHIPVHNYVGIDINQMSVFGVTTARRAKRQPSDPLRHDGVERKRVDGPRASSGEGEESCDVKRNENGARMDGYERRGYGGR
jgi:hypothetical protein